MQLALQLEQRSTWGGAREGAGRKKSSKRMPHVVRPEHVGRYPVHATLRVAKEVGNLREHRRQRAIKLALAATNARTTFGVVQYSAQSTHLHLLIEANDKKTLADGLRALQIRVARALNTIAGRSGNVFTDRYHARALKTPREVRNCLAYVLLNARHHLGERARKLNNVALDPCSSAAGFDGFKDAPSAPVACEEVKRAKTWLLGVGWRKWGLISIHEVPG
jgi:REP element-mobilizing transposase RayT